MDSSDESKSFFKHVFNFDDDSKSEILNILQYSIIAIIPIIYSGGIYIKNYKK